jgi:hypothetical protein
MGIFSNIKNLDSKFSWSFLGFLIGIAGFGYAIYIDYNNDEYTDLSFEIVSNTNVLDLNEEINDLVVNYKGENILQTNRNLKVLTVRVNNTGTKHINNFDYDQSQDWGFKVKNGNIVNNPELISASNSYLKESISNIKADTLGKVIFPKIIIESGENFVVKVLTISSISENPTIQPFGKIAGINKFKVYEAELKSKELNFWQKLLVGNFLVHFVRFFFYLIVIAIFSIGFGLTMSKISDFFQGIKSKKNIEKYRKNTSLEIDENLDKVFEIYIKYQKSFLIKAQKMLSNKDTLLRILKLNSIQHEKLKIARDESPELFEPYSREFVREASAVYPLNDFVIRKLKDYEVLKENDDDVDINENFVKALNDFIYFLKIQ